jgi:hypothetical protein
MVAYLLPDVGLLVTVLGALFGNAAIYALPAALALAHAGRFAQGSHHHPSRDALGGRDAAASTASATATLLGRETAALAGLGGREWAVHGDPRRVKEATWFYWAMVGGAVGLAVAGVPYRDLSDALLHGR